MCACAPAQTWPGGVDAGGVEAAGCSPRRGSWTQGRAGASDWGPATWSRGLGCGSPGIPCLASSCSPPCPHPCCNTCLPPPPQLDSEGLTQVSVPLAAAGQAPEVLTAGCGESFTPWRATVRTDGGLHCLVCAGHPGAFTLLRLERRWVVKGEGVRDGLGEMGESLEHAWGLTPHPGEH